MGPIQPGSSREPIKSWKKINEERKVLKKQRKEEKILKNLKHEKKLEVNKNIRQSLPIKEDPSTISIAVPGSILENAQSAELCTYVAGQIARAACIFRVNEVIVFDDVGVATARETKCSYGEDTGTVRSSSLQLARILQYLECPQYLRKFFFPLHKDLKYSGLLNPLDAPHHLRQQNIFEYREGVVNEKKAKDGKSYVNVGLLNDVLIDKAISPGVRVTVKLENLKGTSKKIKGIVVSPDQPRRETGVYWGYTVRIAHALSEIFTKSPYSKGYDVTIGTSDHGKSIHTVKDQSIPYNHLLMVFGGLKGLEAALTNDDNLSLNDPSLLFDHYINVLPKQGSRTIRTEEAVLIALSAVRVKLKANVEDLDIDLSEYLPRSEDTFGCANNMEQNKNLKSKKNKIHKENEERVKKEHNKFESKKQLLSEMDIEDDLEVVAVNQIEHNNVKTKDLGLSRFD